MKSFIALMLAGLMSVGVHAKPIHAAGESGLDLSYGVGDIGAALSSSGENSLEAWATSPAIQTVTILTSDGGEVTFRSLPRFEKYCRSGQRNAWGFRGRCYDRGDNGASVPEPGTLALLGMGIFLMAISQRRRRNFR